MGTVGTCRVSGGEAARWEVAVEDRPRWWGEGNRSGWRGARGVGVGVREATAG